jgi:hypothetical protein
MFFFPLDLFYFLQGVIKCVSLLVTKRLQGNSVITQVMLIVCLLYCLCNSNFCIKKENTMYVVRALQSKQYMWWYCDHIIISLWSCNNEQYNLQMTESRTQTLGQVLVKPATPESRRNQGGGRRIFCNMPPGAEDPRYAIDGASFPPSWDHPSHQY